MLKKQCSYHSCSKILDDGVMFCPYHQVVYEKERKKRWNKYRKERMKDKYEAMCQRFYRSPTWDRKKEEVKGRCLHIDILEFYRTGKIVEGYAVHHIKELKDEWDLRLDYDNLIYLTKSNHARVHREYDKGFKEKKKMQTILLEIKMMFETEFNL